jgi:hypothetical protein
VAQQDTAAPESISAATCLLGPLKNIESVELLKKVTSKMLLLGIGWKELMQIGEDEGVVGFRGVGEGRRARDAVISLNHCRGKHRLSIVLQAYFACERSAQTSMFACRRA